jgi:cation/acetate symporter
MLSASSRRIFALLALFTLGVLACLLLLGWAESRGFSRLWIGPILLFGPVMLYAFIGVWGRTTDADEYYVAGRRIPAIFNGMATAADWMSAASFLSLAGALYLQGYSGSQGQPGGLAYLLGWTGGFCLVAMLIAPQLRAMQLYTVPDFFQVRFGGAWPRRIAALSAVLCSFTYVVAQIYGVGLIASRLTGVQFEIGIMLGLGGVLLCSFLGGMRAITWTQVAQYMVLLLAFLIPVSWLAYKQLGNPLAPLVYGAQMGRIAEREAQLEADPAEREVAQLFRERAEANEARLAHPDAALRAQRLALERRIEALRKDRTETSELVSASRALAALPRDVQSAREKWSRAAREDRERSHPLGGMPLQAKPYAGDPDGTPAERQEFDLSRRNFLALVFCLMVGTAGLPHLLTRFYTVPSVAAARTSVAWSLVFIALLYVSAPALAVMVKFEVMQHLVGVHFDALPSWVAQWSRLDPSLVSIEDINGDGLVQFGEIRLGADMIMLASSELGGLPYVVSALVAAGGLAAALSTADGLLLTISNALVHDLAPAAYRDRAGTEQRVILTKFTLLGTALIAAAVAAMRPAEILALVSASFSLAASAFVPAMVLGIFWRRASKVGAVCGMVCGLGITVFYMVWMTPAVRTAIGLSGQASLWWGIEPISAGVFGVPLGVLIIVVMSYIRPDRHESRVAVGETSFEYPDARNPFAVKRQRAGQFLLGNHQAQALSDSKRLRG